MHACSTATTARPHPLGRNCIAIVVWLFILHPQPHLHFHLFSLFCPLQSSLFLLLPPLGMRVFRVAVVGGPVTFHIAPGSFKDGSRYFRVDEKTGEFYLKESLKGLVSVFACIAFLALLLLVLLVIDCCFHLASPFALHCFYSGLTSFWQPFAGTLPVSLPARLPAGCTTPSAALHDLSAISCHCTVCLECGASSAEQQCRAASF